MASPESLPKSPERAPEPPTASAAARWAGLRLPPLPEAEAHEKALAKLRAMTPEQKFETLVKAGIYTADGQLAKPYRP